MSDARRYVTTAPENSETPLESIRSWVTPTRLFFVRNHFEVPSVDAESWRLDITGCVERPLQFSLTELADMPQRSVLATVECAGNGRSFLTPAFKGVQWGAGAIAHAEWSGVPLASVLEEAGLRPEALEIVFQGADIGSEPDHPEPMHFARGLPVAKAMHPDTLLATHMNGEPLAPEHGYPARLLVPGWYGVASVKWLTRIEAVATRFRGYFQTVKYTVQRRTPSGLETIPLCEMAIKSAMVRPRDGERLKTGTQRLFGVAWAGEESIDLVEVSTDGGRTWAEAELLGPHARYSWTLWEYLWKVERPGAYALSVRARSSSGRAQPDEYDPLLAGYMIHFCRAIHVEVEPTPGAVAVPRDALALVYDMNAFAQANASTPLDVHLEFSEGAGI
jgi:DMSO/TMAO reductase YedYZ molybdopterin-dependent catalytic subunit